MTNSLDDIFDTDLAVLMHYPTGAGGKFITNCLSLHPAFHPQSPIFLLSAKDRMEYINNALDRYDGEEWDDLGMGCMQFFGVLSMDAEHDSKDIDNHKRSIKKNSMNVLLRVISHNLYFFKTIHSYNQSLFYDKIWRNGRKIIIENCSTFISQRNPRSHRSWAVRDCIDGLDRDGAFIFDGKSLLDWSSYEYEYRRLLSWFNLEPSNIDDIRSFHDRYITAILGKHP